MENKKLIIHEFDPCIYPRLLWVVKGGTLDKIKEILEVGDLDEDNVGGAVTILARKKENGLLGYCVWFPSSSDIKRLDWIAHESAHVALCIFNDIGARVLYEDQEPLAYLVGWAFECIDKVRRIKNGGKSEPKDRKEAIPQEACEAKEENRNG